MNTRLTGALILCGATGLAGCTDPSRLDPNRNYTTETALAGGAMGAIAGIAVGGVTLKSAAIGAAAGAGLGAIAGNHMDKQAAALRQSIGDERISINREGEVLVVSMPQDILFAVNSTNVDPALNDELAALAQNLNQFPATRAEVVGHTDNTGDAAYNKNLSVQRAQAVTSILVANGVAPDRLIAVGLGEDAPIDSNLTEEGRARNRRVDIVIESTES